MKLVNIGSYKNTPYKIYFHNGLYDYKFLINGKWYHAPTCYRNNVKIYLREDISCRKKKFVYNKVRMLKFNLMVIKAMNIRGIV